MAWDRGAEAPGPARYALYTLGERWRPHRRPRWGMDVPMGVCGSGARRCPGGVYRGRGRGVGLAGG
ncbi:MAG: hypothetical protein MZW92_13075 [Comamonadaceae bacterium]|nr:hypothetical protein [Comamonadaceae bacterium]